MSKHHADLGGLVLAYQAARRERQVAEGAGRSTQKLIDAQRDAAVAVADALDLALSTSVNERIEWFDDKEPEAGWIIRPSIQPRAGDTLTDTPETRRLAELLDMTPDYAWWSRTAYVDGRNVTDHADGVWMLYAREGCYPTKRRGPALDEIRAEIAHVEQEQERQRERDRARWPVSCCERDTDGDGNCPVHEAPGVWRAR